MATTRLNASKRRRRTTQRPTGRSGQALAETGFVVVLLTFLALGIAELGWAFMRSNMFVHAIRDGARYGATLGGTTYRDPSTGIFSSAGTDKIRTHVRSLVSSTVGYVVPDGQIDVTQTCDGLGATAVPTVTVRVHDIPFPLLFNVIPGTGSFTVDRSVVFEDEGRKCS